MRTTPSAQSARGFGILGAIDAARTSRIRRSRCRCGSASDTGEAVVALGARPRRGRRHHATGDVVDAAARLQGAAPVNGIACSEQTYRATERVFDFEELASVAVHGGRRSRWRVRAPAPCPSPASVARQRWPAPMPGPLGAPPAREVGADRHVRAFRPPALLPARNAGGRAGGGKEPAVRGALRVRRGSPRARPLARRCRRLPYGDCRDRLLGRRGRSSRQSAASSSRTRRRGGNQASAGASTGRRIPALRLARGPPAAARRGRRRARLAGGVLHRRAPRDRVLADRVRGTLSIPVFDDLHWATEALLGEAETAATSP